MAHVQFSFPSNPQPTPERQNNSYSDSEAKEILTLIHSKPIVAGITCFENTPNPFTAFTTVRFSCSKSEFASVVVLNAAGQELCALFNEVTIADKVYELPFDGLRLPSSVLFCVIQTESARKIIRMVLTK